MTHAGVERVFKGIAGWFALLLALFAMYTSGIALFDEGAVGEFCLRRQSDVIPFAALGSLETPPSLGFKSNHG